MQSEKTLIDVHVHMAAFPDGKNGCLVSPFYRKSLTVKFVKWKMGIRSEDPSVINAAYVERLLRDVRESRVLAKAVLLAFDGVYGLDGRLDENKTTCLISNDYVAEVCREHPEEFLWGASINPQRRDALDELARVIGMGAKLIKVLPNSHNFDPADKAYLPFYRELARTGIPLLTHTGREFSFTPYNQRYGEPERWRMALEEGVTLIAAHACSTNNFFQGKNPAILFNYFKTYPNFFADLSALSLPPSAAMVHHLRSHPEVFDRLLFGTDYPLSAYATSFLGYLPFKSQTQLWAMKNIFDKHAGILAAMGIRLDGRVAQQLLKL